MPLQRNNRKIIPFIRRKLFSLWIRGNGFGSLDKELDLISFLSDVVHARGAREAVGGGAGA